MIKILQMGDTHLGYQYGSDLRRKDYRDAFKECLNIAVEKNVDAIVHTGDFFDNPNPGIEVFNDGLEVLSVLEDCDIPFYGIVGNHERKMKKQWLDIYEKFEMAERLSKEPKEISKDGVTVSLYGIDSIRGPWWDSTDLSLKDGGSDYNFLTMHELLNPPVPEYMADYKLDEVLNRVDINIDVLMLGDYHERNYTDFEGTRVIYSGSTEKTSLDESKDHSVVLHEIDGEKVKRSKIILESPRDFVEMPINLSENDGIHKVEMEIDNTEIMSNNSKEPVLVVRLKGENDIVTPREIKEKYESQFAIVRVIDNRKQVSKDINSEEFNGENVDKKIQDRIKSKDFSNNALKIKEIAEDENIAKTNVRKHVNELLNGDNNEN